MNWSLRRKKHTNEEASIDTPSRLRTRVAVAAGAVALSTAAGAVPALGLLGPGADPDSPYAGSYVLWYANEFAGRVRSFSGCAAEMKVVLDHGGRISVEKGMVAPCVVDVGLDMSAAFRKGVVDAVTGTPAIVDIAIGLLDGTGLATSTELRFQGYMSDVTLPGLQARAESSPDWIRVELVPSTGAVTKVASSRRLPLVGQPDAVDTARSTVRVKANTLSSADYSVDTRLPRADAVTFERPDAGAPGTGELAGSIPGAMKGVLQPTVGVPEAGAGPAAPAQFERWAGSPRAASDHQLELTYSSVSGRHDLRVTLTVTPVRFDPFPRADGHRVLNLAADAAITVSWT